MHFLSCADRGHLGIRAPNVLITNSVIFFEMASIGKPLQKNKHPCQAVTY
jgi:hypothetical protein